MANVKKGKKKQQNIWNFGQRCTKFENILKKGRLLCVINAYKKLLEKALYSKHEKYKMKIFEKKSILQIIFFQLHMLQTMNK